MRREKNLSLVGLMFAFGLLIACGAPDASLEEPAEQQATVQTKQHAESNIYVAGDPSLIDADQPPLASGGVDSKAAGEDALLCSVTSWQVQYCTPFSFTCRSTGSYTCCVSKCREKCRTLCGIPSATCNRLCPY